MIRFIAIWYTAQIKIYNFFLITLCIASPSSSLVVSVVVLIALDDGESLKSRKAKFRWRHLSMKLLIPLQSLSGLTSGQRRKSERWMQLRMMPYSGLEHFSSWSNDDIWEALLLTPLLWAKNNKTGNFLFSVWSFSFHLFPHNGSKCDRRDLEFLSCLQRYVPIAIWP